MKNFRPLEKQQYDEVWDKFDDLFDFKPSISKFPGIKTSIPKLKLGIENCFYKDFQIEELEKLALSLFKNATRPGDRLYALDWLHDCYDFDPRLEMDRDEFKEWIVPIFPNGDYYIFLTIDFNNIWFGHPWEKTITLIGKDFVNLGLNLLSNFKKMKITEHNNGEHP